MSRSVLMSGALAGAAVCGGLEATAFLTPAQGHAQAVAAPTGVAARPSAAAPGASSGWSAAAAMGAAVGVVGAAAQVKGRKSLQVEAGVSSNEVKIPIGKGGFVGASGEGLTVISCCPRTGRAQAQQVCASTAMAAGSSTKTAINGFGRIGRNVLRCWLKRETKPFDIVAINVGSMGAKTAAHLLKYDTVLGRLHAEVSFTDDSITVDGKVFKILSGRDPAAMPWKEMDVEVIIESTGAFNSLDGGSKHLEAGAKKVVLTAPGTNCPTYVVGVNEGDYNPEADTVVSNASCTTNGMASVCKVLDENFDVQYGLMTTTHSYTGDQMILDGRHRDLRRARAGACNIVPTSTGAAKAVAAVLPKYKGKLNGIALRVPTPNVSIVDLVVKVGKKTSGEEVNAALKKAAEGPMKGIINFETQPLVSSDFKQTDYSNSVDAALTMVMGEDLVKVVMWYDNEWGYSQRVIDLTAIVADKLPAGGAAASASTGATQSFQQLSFNYPSSLENIANTNPTQKKTDIICTIGPKSWDPEVLVKLMKAGMNVIRCNFSHGDHEEQSMKLDNLQKAYKLAPEFKDKIKVLMDTRGPEIRTGTFAVYNSKKELKAGQEFTLVCNDYTVKGDESKVAISYPSLPKQVKKGQRILVQDGTCVLEVQSWDENTITCTVLNDCKLGEKKNVNVPGVKVEIDVVGEREIFDIEKWGVPNKADYIALSFVQSPEDIKACRKYFGDTPTKVIAKIENVEGLKNFDAILAEADGIMVARGDLGMEIPMEKIFMAQKMMIQKTKAAGKYVVTATEMLASMEDKPFPTRAEACDVANAVLDGTNAVMLSSESAMGDFPVETVNTMRRICEEAEFCMAPAKTPVSA